MAGLKRMHPMVPVLVGVIALVFGHIYGSFLVKGLGETTASLLAPWLPADATQSHWPLVFSMFWVVIAAVIVFRGLFGHIEKIFYVFLGMLSVSLIGVALWSGPDPVEAVKGIVFFAVPEKTVLLLPIYSA